MRKVFYSTLLFLVGITASVRAQVTIGLDVEPHKSAVLDLQSNGNRGLLLPRVSLTDVDVFGLNGEADTASGMIVYNTNPDIVGGSGEGKDVGAYLWDGEKWMPIVAGGALPITAEEIVSGSTTEMSLWKLNSVKLLSVTGENVTWESEHPTIASVTESGLVTALSEGRATITAKAGGTTTTVKVVVGCGAWAGADITNYANWLVFQCHNLGADTEADPFTPAAEIHGAKYRFGEKEAFVTMENDQDETKASALNWAAALTYMETSADWDMTSRNPCPDGWKVPTINQWTAVYYNYPTQNVKELKGTLTDGSFDAGYMIGKYLFLPAAGSRFSNGSLDSRGAGGSCWSSNAGAASGQGTLMFFYSGGFGNINSYGRTRSHSVRCVKGN